MFKQSLSIPKQPKKSRPQKTKDIFMTFQRRISVQACKDSCRLAVYGKYALHINASDKHFQLILSK
jgi:hypothetical protein